MIPGLKAELKSKSTALSTLRSAPTTDALREAVQTLEAGKQDMEERLRVLKSRSVKPVSVEEKEAAEGEWKRWKRARDARKRAYLELEALLLDSGVITKEALWVRTPTRRDTLAWLSEKLFAAPTKAAR